MKKTLYIFLICSFAYSGNFKVEINLENEWNFIIGDDIEYANPNYDDSDWETVKVPAAWENCGYPGYDGFAWYRIRIYIKNTLKDKFLLLMLGRIDDVDEVYFNGKYLNGSGQFPPDFQTAYNFKRNYPIPKQYINFKGENVIAIRVYDYGREGGIVSGDVGIYSDPSSYNFLIDVSGIWKFSLGDNLAWANTDFNDQKWKNVIVPMKWEQLGYPNYDGYAWYRKKIFFNKNLSNKKLILVLGKIDDMDEIYFNGVRIGRTGVFPPEKYAKENMNSSNPYYNKIRYYFIPQYLIRWDKENVIALRVYDIWNFGGIYEGPVGIITREQYLKKHK